MDLGASVSLRIVKKHLERNNIFSKITGLLFCLEFKASCATSHLFFLYFCVAFLALILHPGGMSSSSAIFLMVFSPCQAEQLLRGMEF